MRRLVIVLAVLLVGVGVWWYAGGNMAIGVRVNLDNPDHLRKLGLPVDAILGDG